MLLYFSQQTIDIVGVLVVLAFGFYAARLLASFRRGVLEKSWKQVAAGAIFLIIAQLILLGSAFGSSSMVTILRDSGTLIRFAGMVFIILGMRSQSKVWRIPKEQSKIETSQQFGR